MIPIHKTRTNYIAASSRRDEVLHRRLCGETQSSIAKSLGVSVGRVRQMEALAFKRWYDVCHEVSCAIDSLENEAGALSRMEAAIASGSFNPDRRRQEKHK